MVTSQQVLLVWGQALLAPRLHMQFAIRGLVTTPCRLVWAMTTELSKELRLHWALPPRDRIAAPLLLLWSEPEQEPLQALPLSATLNEREVDFLSLELVADEDNQAMQCTLQMADMNDWLTALPGSSLTLRLGEQEIRLLVDTRSRTRQFANDEYLIEASSPVSRLAAPFAAPMTRTWSEGTAKEAVQSLCQTAAITLDWRVCDWPVQGVAFESLTPAQMLQQLATEACVAISTLGGEVVVQYRYPVSPSLYGTVNPDIVFSDHDSLLSLQQQNEYSPGYDAVELLVEATGSADALRIVEWHGPDGDAENTLPASQRLVAVFAWPFQEVQLSTSGCQVTIHDQGALDFNHEETIEIVEGKGALTYPVHALLENEYRCAHLGNVTVSGYDAVTEEPGNSLVRIRYQSRCRLFLVQSATREPVQCWVTGAGTGIDSNSQARLYRIQRGQGQRPAPELVVDGICRTPAIARERGRNYLDAVGTSKERYEAQTPLVPLALPGALALVQDASLGERFMAKVTGWTLSANGGDPETPQQAWIRWDLERSLTEG